jgi:cell division protein FtsB
MYNPTEHQEARGTAQPKPSLQPIRAAKRRRQLQPFFFRMGPVTLCVTSVLLIGLMAVLYLSQVGQAVAANQQLQQIHTQQAGLLRQNQDLVDTIAQERGPAYIAGQAKKQGLIPADPKALQIIVVPHLEPMPGQNHNQSIKP